MAHWLIMRCKLFSFLTAGFICTSSALEKPLDIGATLPEVSYIGNKGIKQPLSPLKEKEWLLVYFYPKADTPGCTKQACSLRDAYTELNDLGVEVLGVSFDTESDQKAFAQKYNIPFTLVADKSQMMAKAFGVPKIPVIGLTKRQAFLFKKGILVWRDLQASTEAQAQDILTYIKKGEKS